MTVIGNIPFNDTATNTHIHFLDM